MSEQSRGEDFFEKLAAESSPVEITSEPVASRLKSRIYSAMVKRQTESGPLLSIRETKAQGRPLCVFENLVEISPLGETLKSLNFCRVCHARILAEKLENAPIYWHHCPYVSFQTPRSRSGE